MKKMKKPLAIMMSLCVATPVLASAGCVGTKGSDDPNVLDVYCYIAGYGDSWLTNADKTGVLDIFQEEAWVKEKYPDLKVNYTSDGEAGFATNKLYNQKSNTTDLFFTNWLESIPTNLVVNLTDAVYNTDLPDKPGTKIMDVLGDEVIDTLIRNDAAPRDDGYENMYTLRYIKSFYSFMYNKTVLEHYDLDVPVTTNELISAFETVEATPYNYTVAGETKTSNTGLMMCSKSSYIQYMFPVFWNQYEGVQNYINYYYGKNENDEITDANLKQKGRLRAFQAIEEIVRDHAWSGAAEADHTEAQNQFLLGNGLFHWNGDYFTTEMAGEREQNRKSFGVQDNVGMMATPVISNLVEKLSFYVEEQGDFEEAANTDSNGVKTVYLKSVEKPYHLLDKTKQAEYDKVLAAIVRKIDAGESYTDGLTIEGKAVTQADWNIVKAARDIKGSYSVSGQEAAIPSESPAKELAADFLRFMYTEKAQLAYSNASKGLSFPARYYETLTDEAYTEATKNFEQEAKDKFDLMYKSNATIIPSATSFALGRAGLANFTYSGNMGLNIVTTGTSYKKPVDFFVDDILYYTGANASNWSTLLQLAGLS